MKRRRVKTFLCLAFLMTFSIGSFAFELPSFLTDGNNEASASLGFLVGSPTSGEVFRGDFRVSRNTFLYDANIGLEFTDECLAFLINGGIYFDLTESLRLGGRLTYNPLFMFGKMAEQNIVPAAFCKIEFPYYSKLEIELGLLYKTDHFFSLPSQYNRTHNLSLAFSVYYTQLFDRFSLYGGLTSHTLYTYRLFLQPRWVLGGEFTINDNLSAGLTTAVQYGDVFLSAYIDSFSVDISCKYKF
ncbi:MAG: hypothetical protein K5930_06450 [Treponemataceae bacterium]|nr:hypothetical protein [Treponemataceae bacterium]